MFVVEVIPLDTGAGVERLSYFSSISYPKGAFVAVPIRSREADAIVMSCAPVSSLKTALRAATFTLRKLPQGIERGHLADSFLLLVERIARERALHESDVLSALIPAHREYVRTDTTPHQRSVHSPRTEVIVAPRTQRYTEYKRIVREAFAAHGSVLFVAPTIRDLEQALRELSPGIENHTLTLSGEMKAATHRKAQRMIKSEHPLLIISSPAYAHVERGDITTVIIESARSHAYHGIARPYLDHRAAITAHAQIRNATVVLGDLLLPSEDIHHLRERTYEYIGHSDFPKRLDLPGTLHVIAQKKDPDGTIPFTLFSPELEEAIRSTLDRRERMFLLSARRGLAPLVACADCGHIFRDNESGSPLSLIAVEKPTGIERHLVSSTTGFRMPMPDVCPVCNSWRLRERGIGIQHIETELRARIPDLPLTVFDHTTAKTLSAARTIAHEFDHAKGALLLGTPRAIPYLEKAVDRSAIVSMDSLLATPSWRQQEEVLATLLALRECTKGVVLAQTRHHSDDRILTLAARAELSAFYDEELGARRAFSYPPYAVFVLLSYQGSKEALKATEEMLEAKFSQYGISFYGMPPSDSAHVLRRGLLRFPKESWPHPEVAEKLRTLPPSIKIEFDPDRIV